MRDERLADEDLASLCRREHTRLVGLLALHVGDRWIAEELAQEALVRLCVRWPRVERPQAWLTRVALNAANSWLRRRFAERRANQRHHEASFAAPVTEPEDVLALRAAVSQLPVRQRTALVLRYYEGMSVAETAQLMRCAEGTVKALTHRALDRLARVAGLEEERADA